MSPRALTFWRPWAWSIIHGPKRIENRPWKPPDHIIGQRILIHAGAKLDTDGATFIADTMRSPLPPEAKAQGIIGRARVTGCLVEGKDQAPPGQEPWWFGPFGWVLADVEGLPAPIACRGMLGLWTVPDAVLAQLPAGWR